VRLSILLLAIGLFTVSTQAATVSVRYIEGTTHGFIALRDEAGRMLAAGQLLQTVHNPTITSRLVFQFKDGSVWDDTTVFSQKNQFRLISDHLIQKGPAFTEPADVLVDTGKHQVTVHPKGGAAAMHDLDMPADISNGLMLILLKNVSRSAVTTVSMVGDNDKPRIVQLSIRPVGVDAFQIDGVKHKAYHFVLHTEIGGITGLLAKVLRKQPEDLHVWMAAEEPPTFVRFTGPLYVGGPTWRAELSAPIWQTQPER
jgi:hypothetical protein